MVPRMLHPLPKDEIEDWFSTLNTLIVIEMSYSGQFMMHLRSNISLPPTTAHYARSGGSLIMLEDVLNLIIEHTEESISDDQKEIIDPEGMFNLDKPPKVDVYLRGEVCET
jgi:pyruvate/2-oxoacid:ferredoxin oxidoreductase alpha subunit